MFNFASEVKAHSLLEERVGRTELYSPRLLLGLSRRSCLPRRPAVWSSLPAESWRETWHRRCRTSHFRPNVKTRRSLQWLLRGPPWFCNPLAQPTNEKELLYVSLIDDVVLMTESCIASETSARHKYGFFPEDEDRVKFMNTFISKVNETNRRSLSKNIVINIGLTFRV